MASFKSMVRLWRRIKFRPIVPRDLAGTTLELMLDQLIDIAALSRLPPLSQRGGY